MKFSETSLKKLETCDEKLQEVAKAAIIDSPLDFMITFGARTADEQKKLYDQGRTAPGKIVTYCDGLIKKSPHNYLPSKAFDIAVIKDGKITWDPKYYAIVAEHILKKANDLGIKITWGGSWPKFKDWPHFQIL